MNQNEAEEKIRELKEQAKLLIKEATELADAHGIEFFFSVAYGMGGSYYPDPARKGEWEGDPDDYWFPTNEYGDDGGFWRASSHRC